MKVTVLTENTAYRADVVPQHGLSLYIESNGCKILFDMGQDDTFARNAEVLGIDLSKVDFAILSHGHYDRGGGLAEFLRHNQTAPVYIHEQAFGPYYNGTEKYIGLDVSFKDHPRLIFTKQIAQLPCGMQLIDCNDLGWIYNSWGLHSKIGDGFIPDAFLHEQYLLIQEGEKRYLISGCSHKGIVNIAEYFCPDVLVGGFHINKLEEKAVLHTIAESLLNVPPVYYTGHCTGGQQSMYLKQIMGERLQILTTGMTIEA